ncbi:probable indole-3-pyruvate monooxygenase YUCCA10 [Tanacetum coccineum]
MEQTELADVLIPISLVFEVHAWFENTLYRYFLRMNVAFPVCGKWTPSSKLSKQELTCVYVWIKIHGVPVLMFTTYGLSAISIRLGTPIMLDSCITTTCMQSWGRMDYARALVDIRADRVLKDTMMISVPTPVGNGVMIHTIKVEYEWKPSRYGTCLVFGHDDAQCPKHVIADLRNSRKQEGTSYDGFQTVQKNVVCDPIVSKHGTRGNHSLPKQLVRKSAYQKKTTSIPVSNAFFALGEGFTSPNPFDFHTKDDGKSIFA